MKKGSNEGGSLQKIDGCYWIKGASLLSQPSLTRTSRRVRDEALPIYYGENEIWVSLLEMDRRTGDSFCAAAEKLAKRFSSTLRLTRNLRIMFTEVHLKVLAPVDNWHGLEDDTLHFTHRHSGLLDPGPMWGHFDSRGEQHLVVRIGDDEINWSHKQTVANALRQALPMFVRKHVQDGHCAWFTCLLKVLQTFAKEVPRATKCLFYHHKLGELDSEISCPFSDEQVLWVCTLHRHLY